MRIVMMGTGTFAEPTLMALLASSHSVVGLFTQPDKAIGTERGSPRVLADRQRGHHGIGRRIDLGNGRRRKTSVCLWPARSREEHLTAKTAEGCFAIHR
jgi:hypothetical protein